MNTSLLLQLRSLITRHEGNCTWLYACTADRPTVGVGHMLLSIQDFAALKPVSVTDPSKPATPMQIEGDWALVQNAKQRATQYAASWYATRTRCRLTPQTVSDLLDADIASCICGLHLSFVDFDQYPDGAKLALIDLVYQTGLHGLLTGFPHLVMAVNARDWAEAAKQSHRAASSEARNQETAKLFSSAC